jgi:hypothetical protein
MHAHIKTNIYFSVVLLFILSTLAAFTRDGNDKKKINYRTVQDSISPLSCGKTDSATVYLSKFRLESLDSNLIDSNIHIYFHDLGWCYYRTYLKSKNLAYIYKAVDAYKHALHHKSDYVSVMWNMAFCQYLICQCSIGDFYIELFKKLTPEEHWNTEQINRMKKNCEE